MKNIYVFILLIFIAKSPFLFASDKTGDITVKDYKIERKGEKLYVNITVDANDVAVASREEQDIRPVIVTTANDSIYLPPLLLVGKNRDKVNKRKTRLYGVDTLNDTPLQSLVLKEFDDKTVEYEYSLPFENRMYGAQVILLQEVRGCADCRKNRSDIAVARIQPQPKVSFITPKPVTQGEKLVSLYVRFQWNKYIIDPSLGNNARELGKIERALDTVKQADNFKITEIHLKGFSSPEGLYSHNAALSEKRARAMGLYIEKKFPEDRKFLVIDSEPEDWEGLKKNIELLNIPDKERIINVIETVVAPDAREIKMREVAGRETYQYLLKNVYPLLRRVDARIKYGIELKHSVDEMWEIVENRPEELELNDYYLLAAEYPVDSEEFKKLTYLVWERYPDDNVVCVNRAAFALEEGDLKTAWICLEKEWDNPEALNNYGVMLARQEKMDEAAGYFKKAYKKGNKEAAYNLQYIEPQ